MEEKKSKKRIWLAVLAVLAYCVTVSVIKTREANREAGITG